MRILLAVNEAERFVSVVRRTLLTAFLIRAFGTPMSFEMFSNAILRAAVADLSTARRIALRIPRALRSPAHFVSFDASIVTVSIVESFDVVSCKHGPPLLSGRLTEKELIS